MERVEGEPLRKGTARLAESLDALKSPFHSTPTPPFLFPLLQLSLKITFFHPTYVVPICCDFHLFRASPKMPRITIVPAASVNGFMV